MTKAARALMTVLLFMLAGCVVSPTVGPVESSPAKPGTTTSGPGELGPLELPAEIVVLGDFGSGSGGQYDVAETMQQVIADRDIQLLLTTGDNFYSDDVDEIWHRPYGWLASQGIEVAAAWGNHDVETETRLALVQETLDPPGRWYSIPLGDGKIIVLDSNQVDSDEQIEWLRSELESTGTPVIISFHHPAFSCGVYADYEDVRQTWLPVIQPFEVALVLNGHEHHYERFEVAAKTYVVTGGGGMKIRDRHECSEGVPEPIVGNYRDQHFVLLTVNEGVIHGEAYDVDGEIIDRFSVDY